MEMKINLVAINKVKPTKTRITGVKFPGEPDPLFYNHTDDYFTKTGIYFGSLRAHWMAYYKGRQISVNNTYKSETLCKSAVKRYLKYCLMHRSGNSIGKTTGYNTSGYLNYEHDIKEVNKIMYKMIADGDLVIKQLK